MQPIPSTFRSRFAVMLLTFFLAFTLSAGAGDSGPESTPASDTFVLTLGGHSFDPLDQGGVADLFAAHQSDPSGDFHLIQFDGPIQSHWIQGLSQHGIEVVQYVHPYTYIVWAEQAQMNSVRGISGVRWSGPFLPEFRVIPEQRGLGSDVEPTNLLVSRHADQRAVRADLELLGVEVLHSQRYLGHFMLLETAARGDAYMDLGRMAAVYTVQQAVPMAPRGEMSNQSIVGNYGPAPGHQLFPGYANWLTDTGYDGTGVTVSIIDGGVRESHQDLVDNMVSCVSQGSPTSCTTSNNTHGSHVAGAVGGSGASGTMDPAGFLSGQGVAPGASLVQQRYGSPGLSYNFGSACNDPTSYCTTPSGMLVLFKEAALSGATHANNSWGSLGIKIGYDLPTQQVDVMTRDATPDNPVPEPVLPVWSIMNGNGDQAGACNNNSLGSPDEAKNLFAIGSTRMQTGVGQQFPNIFDVSPNSAHGPACDGRVGVHMVAPGCSTDAPSGTGDTAYTMLCGTSMASPVASGALAVFIERYRDLFGGATPSPAMMKAAFMAVSTNLHGFANADGGTITETPSRFQGYGRIDLDAVVNPDNDVMFFDQEEVFTATGQDWGLPLMAVDPSEPVRMMMVFTDAYGHGLGGTTPAWVNDLNLTVSVGGNLYLGNQIGSDGFSETGGSADFMNNMEAVFLRPDQHNGDVFDVSVLAANIAADAINPHNPSGPSQDFALVCYNCMFGDPTFSIGLDPDFIGACVPDAGSENHDVLVQVGALGAYTGTVNLSASGEPAGVSTSFDPTSVVVPGTSDLTLTVDSTASAGTSIITVSGDDGDDVHQRDLTLVLDDPLLSGPTLNSPADGAIDLTLTPTFDWDALPDVAEYRIQVATDAGFSTLIYDEVVEDTSFVVEAELDTGTEYFWRVQGINLCGDGAWSDVFSFTTRLEPEADFSATSFAFVVEPDDSDSQILEIGNVGTGNLTFDIETDTPDTSAAGRDFEGPFHPDNWDLVNNPANTGGSVNVVDGPPVEVYVTGGNNSEGGDTDFEIEIPMDGTITFDWGYQSTDSGNWDSGGYAINGAYTELADNDSQVPYFNASATVEVSAGDTFAFRVNTVDGLLGAGIFGVTNFDFAPAVCGGDIVPVPWLSATPASGSVPQGDSESVTVSVDTTGLTPGDYEGYLCVSTNDPAAELVPMQVELTVSGDPVMDPQIEVTPDEFAFSVAVDGSTSDTMMIANIGDGTLNWTVDTAEVPAGVITYASAGREKYEPVFSPQGWDRDANIAHDGQAEGFPAAAILGGPIAEFEEGFEDINTLPGAGWSLQNLSNPLGTSGWFQGNSAVFPAHQGPPTSYIGANFNNASGVGTISNWLMTPEVVLQNGTELRFFTRGPEGSTFPDRLEVRLSTSGDSTDAGSSATDTGDFDTLLLSINENLSTGGYPEAWTEYVVEVSGLAEATSGRFAFRYFVTNSGPSGTNGDYIGIDTVSVDQPEVDPEGCDAPATISWLSVSPDSGSTASGDASPVSVDIDATGLPEGLYEALLCVNSDDPANPRVEVPVELEVTDQAPADPIASLDPAEFEFSVGAGDGDSDVLNITNEGGGTLVWSIETAEPASLVRGGDIVEFTDVNFQPNPDFTGGSVQWHTGDTCNCDTAPFDLNIWASGGDMAFFWPRNAVGGEGGVSLDGATYAVLEPGDSIGPGSDFLVLTATPATANWRQVDGVDGYLGFRFTNPTTSQVNYGYARITTTGTTGFPVTVVSWAFNQAGDPITIPTGEPVACDDPTTIAWLSVDPVSGSTEAGQTSPVDVLVDSDGLAEGSYEALLCVTTNDPDAGLIEVPVSLEVTEPVPDPGELSVSPTDLAFGGVALGDDATLGFTVSNVAAAGAMSLELSTLALSGDAEFAISGGDCTVGTQLDPGEDCSVEVTFTPSAVASFSGQVDIATSDGQDAAVTLSGEGTQDAGELSVTPAELDFGSVAIGQGASLNLVVSNTAAAGAAGLELSALDLSGDTEFAITGGDCAVGTELEPGESCSVEVTFEPSAEAAFSGQVTVETTDAQSQSAMLIGEGFQLPDGIFHDRFEVQE